MIRIWDVKIEKREDLGCNFFPFLVVKGIVGWKKESESETASELLSYQKRCSCYNSNRCGSLSFLNFVFRT